MIKKLKRKVVALTMTSLFILLALMVAGMNLINYHSVVQEADRTLSLLSQNRGAFSEPAQLPNQGGYPFDKDFSPELPYESRYFSVLLDNSGEAVQTDVSKIAAINSDEAVTMAIKVQKNRKMSGFAGSFRYRQSYEIGGTRIIFLDCGRKLDAFYRFLYSSIAISLTGFGLVFFVIVFISGRIIRPIAESYEKQKRFITDAGHEIKTPLTIINANVDVLEMDVGRNECLEDIQQQTRRLTALTNDLVMLARMEEAEDSMTRLPFPASEVIYDAAMSFKILADAQNKQLQCDVQPLLSMRGNDKSVEQLVTLLMDNALKYTPVGGAIDLSFTKQGKYPVLTVRNPTDNNLSKEDMERIFDRFYRADLSRNSETGGHGIGLSVAKAIVTAHGGKIQASCPGSGVFQITVTFRD